MALALFNLVTLTLSDFTITFEDAINKLYFALTCIFISLLTHKKFPRFAIILATPSFFVLILMQSIIASYLGMSFRAPPVDATLAAIDNIMGFDWFAYLAFMNERPWFISYTEWCYDALFGANLFAILYFLILNNNLRLQELLCTQTMMLVVTIFVGALVPALGTFAH